LTGKEIVGSDDHTIGTIVAERDGCAIVEIGHVFKSKHAVPEEFLHDHDGVIRATIAKDLVADSPKVSEDDWDIEEVKAHYGLVDTSVVDPDPELPNAESDGVRHGIEPGHERRLGTLGGANDPSIDRPSGFDRMTNSNDPAWTAAGISGSDPQRDDAIDRDEYLGDPPR
jgi:hypothetical protein